MLDIPMIKLACAFNYYYIQIISIFLMHHKEKDIWSNVIHIAKVNIKQDLTFANLDICQNVYKITKYTTLVELSHYLCSLRG